MNFSTTTAAAPPIKFSHAFRLSASLIYDLLLIFVLILNLFLMAVYVKGHKLLKNMAFFIISWQMLINNLIMLIVMIIFMTSVIFFDTPVFSDSTYFVLSFAESLGYNGLLNFASLLTVNRLMVFATHSLEKFFFSRPTIFVVITACWLLTGGLTTGIMTSPCPIAAKPGDLGFGSNCLNGAANVYNYIGQSTATYFPLAMIAVYVLIYIEIKIGIFCNGWCCRLDNLFRSKQNQQHKISEIKLLFQAALICSTFFIQNFCWTYLPFLTVNFSMGDEIIFLAIMFSSILLYSVDAGVILVCNSMIKSVAITFFKADSKIVLSQYRGASLTVSVAGAVESRRSSVRPM